MYFLRRDLLLFCAYKSSDVYVHFSADVKCVFLSRGVFTCVQSGLMRLAHRVIQTKASSKNVGLVKRSSEKLACATFRRFNTLYLLSAGRRRFCFRMCRVCFLYVYNGSSEAGRGRIMGKKSLRCDCTLLRSTNNLLLGGNLGWHQGSRGAGVSGGVLRRCGPSRRSEGDGMRRGSRPRIASLLPLLL